jgi:hypothetical protein
MLGTTHQPSLQLFPSLRHQFWSKALQPKVTRFQDTHTQYITILGNEVDDIDCGDNIDSGDYIDIVWNLLIYRQF